MTALAFATAVVGWMAPGLFKVADLPGADWLTSQLGVAGSLFVFDAPLPEASWLKTHLPGGAVGIGAASLLFLFLDERGERVLPWSEANRIDWGIIMLFGGGLSLGRQMVDTGLAEALSRGFVETSGVSDVWTLTALITVFTIFFTETCSNTATSSMLAPLAIAVSKELGVSPVAPVLAVGLAASCAFMLPIATGPNAIAYGTGRVTQGQMMRSGLVLNLGAAVLIVLILRVFVPLLGWG